MNQSPQLFKRRWSAPALSESSKSVRSSAPRSTTRRGTSTQGHQHRLPSRPLPTTRTPWTPASPSSAPPTTVEANCQEQPKPWTWPTSSRPRRQLPRLTYEEAIERINATGELDETLVWGDDLPTEGEHALGQDVGEHCFITDWPSEIKPFYIMDKDDDVSTGFDMMHPSMELVSGGAREHRYDELVAGFEQQGLDPEAFDYYTKMFKYGMPPAAGWGLGGERLVMTMLGLRNIREAVLFPRDRQRLSP